MGEPILERIEHESLPIDAVTETLYLTEVAWPLRLEMEDRAATGAYYDNEADLELWAFFLEGAQTLVDVHERRKQEKTVGQFTEAY